MYDRWYKIEIEKITVVKSIFIPNPLVSYGNKPHFKKNVWVVTCTEDVIILTFFKLKLPFCQISYKLFSVE
ncbi:hypothetical protein BrL25_14390 [Brevibacillus laterosporus DSM 25]|nr:hypothetical protein BrL25_14390 [Brevibacillus laterosporus DSM 25]